MLLTPFICLSHTPCFWDTATASSCSTQFLEQPSSPKAIPVLLGRNSHPCVWMYSSYWQPHHTTQLRNRERQSAARPKWSHCAETEESKTLGFPQGSSLFLKCDQLMDSMGFSNIALNKLLLFYPLFLLKLIQIVFLSIPRILIIHNRRKFKLCFYYLYVTADEANLIHWCI